MSYKNKEVYAFIDSQNLNLGVRSQGWELDFRKFRLYLENKYNVKKAFLFIGYISSNKDLYKYLQRCGYILIFKPTLEFKQSSKTKVKGNVDAELVLYTMIEKDNYDEAIIVSGDGDFCCLIEYLVEHRKLKKLLVPSKRYSSLLRRFNRYIVEVGLLRTTLMKEKTETSGRSKP